MKKIKLLTPILTAGAVVATTLPIASCATYEPIKLSDVNGRTQNADATNSGNYIFVLDGQYKKEDIKVVITSENKNDFFVTWETTNELLVVKCQYIGALSAGKETIYLNISTEQWKRDFIVYLVLA